MHNHMGRWGHQMTGVDKPAYTEVVTDGDRFKNKDTPMIRSRKVENKK